MLILQERRKKIAPVLNRILNRLLTLTFYPWQMIYYQTVKVKHMIRRAMLGNLQSCFEIWCVLKIQNKENLVNYCVIYSL